MDDQPKVAPPTRQEWHPLSSQELPMDRKYRIVGETYGTLAVIVAPSPRAALGLFLSWFTDPNGPQLKRTGETTARYADGERVTVR